MESEFITYQKFNDVALANALAEQLEQQGIEYNVEEESLTFNPSFALNDELSKEYAVKIKAEDFEKVNQLLKENEDINIDDVEKDYYLFGFTDDELMEVIAKADEWSPFDVVLARKILEKRGKNISDETISTINKQRVEELKAPEPPQTTWVVIGYIIALSGIILPFFICIIGLFIGWHLSSYKRTLPDGERVYEYSENDRKHGKRIFYLSIIMFFLDVVYVIVHNNYFRYP